MIELGTKAETLERLSSFVKNAKILPQLYFTKKGYQINQRSIFSQMKKKGWLNIPIIVRSSSKAEDLHNQSLAGHFTSILNVQGKQAIEAAIERVMSSFQDTSDQDQILIQPMLSNVALSGVALSKHPTSAAPYILINYDDSSQSTSSVTSGTTNQLKSYCHYRYSTFLPPHPLDQIIHLVIELEELLKIDNLDIEFALTKSGELFLFQVRPLIISSSSSVPFFEHNKAINQIAQKIKQSYGPHPYLHGSRTIYGIMPDWNPAEIIGVRPKPLALSLYKEIITDQIWAYQRNNYGYCNLRSFPLLIDFHGLPYIDVRVSFNSFIPKLLDKKIAAKLVNYYLSRLQLSPSLHDKVEFEILFSCYTLDLPERLQVLKEYQFTQNELEAISLQLRNLTNNIIDENHGLWKLDSKKITELDEKYDLILHSNLDIISKIYWLLEDCKRYGTLPFAGLARAGFIAIQMLQSLVNTGVLNTEEYNQFLLSLNTVNSSLTQDLAHLSKASFLKKYGHLRPGTYDILSPRYDEDPEAYFDWNKTKKNKPQSSSFSLSLSQLKRIELLLKNHGLNHNVLTLFDFIKGAIEGREYAKFIFSRNLSQVLHLIKQLGKQYDISESDCAFIDITSMKKLYASSMEPGEILKASIEKGKASYAITEQLILPPLIHTPDQIFSFEFPTLEPNYITLKTARGLVTKHSDKKSLFKNSILFIPSADPGYDWIFSHQIAGFITMYGGMNSHMAIRAGELGIPAVIGAGEALYRKWEKGGKLEIDCANRLVRILHENYCFDSKG